MSRLSPRRSFINITWVLSASIHPSIQTRGNKSINIYFPTASPHSIIISRLQSSKIVFDFFSLAEQIFLCCFVDVFGIVFPSRSQRQRFREAIIANGILNASDFNLFPLCVCSGHRIVSKLKHVEICPPKWFAFPHNPPCIALGSLCG